MDYPTKQHIRELIDTYSKDPIARKITPCDYPGTKEYMLQFELNQEVAKLSAMLNEPETFAENFLARCHWRNNNPDQVIPFSDMPESPSNKLYWEIALLVFQPKTMQEMLHLVASTITQEISIDLILHQPKDIKRLTMPIVLKYTVPEASLSDINNSSNSLSGPPYLEDLAHYVLSENAILDVSAIEKYSFDLHVKLYRALEQNHPELAKKLYTHNANLKSIASDIVILEEKRRSPQNGMPVITLTDAIKEFIAGLKRGGGGYYAGSSSEQATRRFFTYFNALPLEVQNRVKALGLNSIILNITGCVYGSASSLNNILPSIANDYELNHFLPTSAQDHLNQINEKYQVGNKEFTIETKKDNALNTAFPDPLLIEAIKNIPSSCFNRAEDLSSFFASFPPRFYNTLMHNLKIPLNQFTDAIGRGYFNPEQRKALAPAMANSKIINKQKLLSWAVLTKDPFFIIAALEVLPEQQRQDAVIEMCSDKQASFLYNIAEFPELLKTLLQFYPEEQRMEVFKLVISSIKDRILTDTTVLDEMAALIPEKDRMQAREMLKNYKKVSKLFASVADINAMEILLEQEALEQRLPLLTALTNSGETVMHQVVKSISAILSIHWFLPDNQITQAAMAKNNLDHSALYYAKSSPHLLQTIYSVSDLEQKINVVKDKVRETGVCNLDKEDFPLVELIIECFPEQLGLDTIETLQEMAANLSAPQNKQEFLLLLEIHLSIIEKKTQELNDRNEHKANSEAKQLHKELRQLKYQLSNDTIDLPTFKRCSSKAIKSARLTLTHHRGAIGLLEALAHCALFILGCGLLYLAARKYNPNFFIFKTDSENKLELLEHDIYTTISV